MDMIHEESGDHGRFYIQQGEKMMAELVYQYETPEIIDACHTFVSPELRGQGIAEKLYRVLTDFVKREHLVLHASCSYIAIRMKKDKSMQDQMAVLRERSTIK